MRHILSMVMALSLLFALMNCSPFFGKDGDDDSIDWGNVVPPEYGSDTVLTEDGEPMFLTGGEDAPELMGGDIPSNQYLTLLGKGWDIFGQYGGAKGSLAQVLDIDALLMEGRIETQPIGMFEAYTVSGEQSSNFQEELGIKAGLTGKYKFFSGELKTAYDTKVVSSRNYQFATIQCLYENSKVVLKDRFKASDLSTYLTSGCQADLNDTSLTPAAFFKIYGTHVLTGAIMGARYDYHFSAIKTNRSSTLSISAYAEAVYKNALKDSCKGSFSSDQKILSTTDFSESSGKVKALGGRATSAGLSKEGFDTWEKSIDTENGTNLQLVGFEENGLMPVWEFCTNTARKANFESAFDDWSEEKYKLYYSNVPQKESLVALQVKTNNVGEAFKEGSFTYYRINQDLNEGAGGSDIFLYAAFGPDTDTSCQPIIRVALVCAAALEIPSNAAKVAKRNCTADYQFINVDLNKAAGGSYVYLVYKRRTVPDERPIRNLYTRNKSDNDTRFPDLHPDNRYPTVIEAKQIVNGKMTDQSIDLNWNAGGDVIYLQACYDID